jgi:hypothetical protein
MRKLALTTLLLGTSLFLPMKLASPRFFKDDIITFSPFNIIRYHIKSPKPVNETEIRESFKKTNSIFYHSDSSVNYLQSPRETKSLGFGNCGDKAICTYFELQEMGYEPLLCYGVLKEGRPVSHLWNELIDNLGRIYIVESATPKTSNIYLRDTLDKRNYILREDEAGLNYIENQRNDFEKRNGIKLRIKYLE